MAIEKGQSLAAVALAEPTVDVIQLDLNLDFCFAVQDLMEREGITRKQLAKRMHKSPSAITRILNGDANITLRTLAEFMKALDLHVDIYPGQTLGNGATESRELPGMADETPETWGLSAQTNILQRVREC